MYDEGFIARGRGVSGGVNVNATTLEDCRRNIADCLDQVFAGGVPERVERLYITFVGPAEEFISQLEQRVAVGEVVRFTEVATGLLAGALKREGVLALAGTGSDVFYIREDSTLRRTVGGWGPILGDQGSGSWIGITALRAVVAAIEGWGEPSALVDAIRREWALEKDWDMVPKIYRAPAPYRLAASLTPLVGRVASEGDALALRILREAGECMATQILCLFRRESVPEEFRSEIVLAGGAWKSHSVMRESFAHRVQAEYPETAVRKPLFEPVMAGVASQALEACADAAEARQLLEKGFPEYMVKY
jgi:N-acetylglucosamine kinase-like BadF-type ATPase